MNQKIMIVDKDPTFAQNLQNFLIEQDFDVILAASAEEAQLKFLIEYPCMVLLELELPQMSGEAFCQWVREQDAQEVSIIMVTHKHLVEDKINGLKIGADDYLVKPVHFEELLAHMEAVLRRTGLFCQKIIHNGLCIKPRKNEVLLNGEHVHLTKHEFLLLYYFMEKPSQLITREDLITFLYPNVEKEILDRTIDAHIKKLRKKIELDSKNPERIITMRGLGYKFIP